MIALHSKTAVAIRKDAKKLLDSERKHKGKRNYG